MAKARMVRSELRTSTVVAEWPIEARYFWILLWGYVDDYGRAKDNARLIKADCFPLDDEVTTGTIEQWLTMFADSGVIVRYTVDGSDYLAVKNWEEHQKVPHPGKDACPDWRDEKALMRAENETSVNVSGNLHESSTPKLREVKLKETNMFNDVERASIYSDDFEAWWNAYPRKQAKGDAWKAWKALRRELPDVSVLVAAAESYARTVTDPQFLKMPGPWLRARRWEDAELVVASTEPAKRRFTSYVD